MINYFKKIFYKFKTARAYVAGNLTGATQYAKKCLAITDDDVFSLWMLAECMYSDKKYDKAMHYASKVVSIDKENEEAIKLLAILYFDCGDYVSTYEYVYRAVMLHKRIDEDIRTQFDKLVNKTVTLKPIPDKLKVIHKSIINDIDEAKDWMEWASQFKEWYEKNQTNETAQPGRLTKGVRVD